MLSMGPTLSIFFRPNAKLNMPSLSSVELKATFSTVQYIAIKYSTVSTVKNCFGALFSTLQYTRVQSVQYSTVSTVQSWSPVVQGCRAGCTAGFGPCQFYRAINFFGAVPRKCLHFTFSNPIVQYITVKYSILQYSTVQNNTVQYSTLQYTTV